MATRACFKLLRSVAAVKITPTARPILCLNASYGRHSHVGRIPSYSESFFSTSTITECRETAAAKEDSYICRVRGLNFRTRKEALQNFLADKEINVDNIEYLLNLNGRFTGIAFVSVKSEEDVQRLLAIDHEYLEDRYLEINRTSAEQLRKFDDPALSRVVKLTGLPYTVTRDDIWQFFDGLEIVRNGIKLPLGPELSSNGIGFVLFATIEDANAAVERSGESIGPRYVIVKKWTLLTQGKKTKQNRRDFASPNRNHTERNQQELVEPDTVETSTDQSVDKSETPANTDNLETIANKSG